MKGEGGRRTAQRMQIKFDAQSAKPESAPPPILRSTHPNKIPLISMQLYYSNFSDYVRVKALLRPLDESMILDDVGSSSMRCLMLSWLA
jgi:hypothetical protein